MMRSHEYLLVTATFHVSQVEGKVYNMWLLCRGCIWEASAYLQPLPPVSRGAAVLLPPATSTHMLRARHRIHYATNIRRCLIMYLILLYLMACNERSKECLTWVLSLSVALLIWLTLSRREAAMEALAPPAACRCSASPPAKVA